MAAEAKRDVSHEKARSSAVVDTYVVSKEGARVVERVVVLSAKAAQRLEIKGRVPSRDSNGHAPAMRPPKHSNGHSNGSASR